MSIQRFSYNIQLTNDQLLKLEDWKKEQTKKSNPKPTVGQCYSWIIGPTSMGTMIQVEHNITKERIDLTDYNSW